MKLYYHFHLYSIHFCLDTTFFGTIYRVCYILNLAIMNSILKRFRYTINIQTAKLLTMPMLNLNMAYIIISHIHFCLDTTFWGPSISCVISEPLLL